MEKQPEALRLADALVTPYTDVRRLAAAELRRLHAVERAVEWAVSELEELDEATVSVVVAVLKKQIRSADAFDETSDA